MSRLVLVGSELEAAKAWKVPPIRKGGVKTVLHENLDVIISAVNTMVVLGETKVQSSQIAQWLKDHDLRERFTNIPTENGLKRHIGDSLNKLGLEKIRKGGPGGGVYKLPTEQVDEAVLAAKGIVLPA